MRATVRHTAALAVLGAFAALPAGGATGAAPPPPGPNPCLTEKARELLCPTITINRPAEMYFDRRPGGRLVLRATSSINSVGDGPVEMHGTRTGPSSMDAVQRIYRRTGGYMTVRTGARLGFKSIPGQYRYWKLLNAARFELWSLDAEGKRVRRVRTGPKLFYCLRDLKRTHPRAGSPRFPHYPRCSQDPNLSRVVLGTSVGWSDIYPATYHEQWIDVTGLHGRFLYVLIADPTGVIYTTNTQPPSASLPVTIP